MTTCTYTTAQLVQMEKELRECIERPAIYFTHWTVEKLINLGVRLRETRKEIKRRGIC